MATLWLSGVLVVTLIAQALLPSVRLMVVAGGAAVSCLLAAWTGVATTQALFAAIPWDVLLILIALGLFTELLVDTRLFGILALVSSRRSRGNLRRIIVLFTIAMYGISALVNNLTAILFVLPILLILLKLLGAEQRYVSWTLGLVLVACNLGGAATPIGDFPAILLLGRGSMTFTAYLTAAAPPTALALALVILVGVFVIRPERGVPHDPFSARLTLTVMEALYRNVRLDWKLLLPAFAVLVLMLIAWVLVPASSGIGPELIAWLGAGCVLLLRPRRGEELIRRRVDVEAVVFLFSLFLMVGAVSKTGAFGSVARGLQQLPIGPLLQLVVFLLLTGVITGLFSAGPSMAALLEVAESLAKSLPPTAVYVGLALSVCAGSSLFLTAATSGPMAQILTERADMRDTAGRQIRFGFFEFLPVGLMCFAIIQIVAIGFALVAVAAGR